MSGIYAVVVAAGLGKRFSSDLPKQFLNIDGEVVLKKVVRFFLSTGIFDGIVCVIPKGFSDLYHEIFNCQDDERLLPPVFGEKFRQGSVRNGLRALREFSPQHVLIHDAARFCVSQNVVDNVVESLRSGKSAVVPVVRPVDSVLYLNKTIDRADVGLVQTPQGFDFDLISMLHEKHIGKNFCDDGSLCECEGVELTVVLGGDENKKLTFNKDIVSQTKSHSAKIKIGFGFDAHAFSSEFGRKLFLMGVAIDFPRGLHGFSDADVGIHSIVDAILGAAGAGNIGEAFPDNDPKFKDVDSKIFLQYCKELMLDLGYRIVNIDSTIVCEAPRISLYSEQMKNTIATCLNMASEDVSIKGKTTEGMGYEGRAEGISAYSSVLIEKITSK